MAIIEVTASIDGKNSLQDDLDLVGSSGTVGITGDVIVDRIQVANSAEQIFDARGTFVVDDSPAYIFIKFIAGGTNQHITITDGSSAVYLKMFANEVALLPWNGTLDLYAIASGTAEETLEIAIFVR